MSAQDKKAVEAEVEKKKPVEQQKPERKKDELNEKELEKVSGGLHTINTI